MVVDVISGIVDFVVCPDCNCVHYTDGKTSVVCDCGERLDWVINEEYGLCATLNDGHVSAVTQQRR